MLIHRKPVILEELLNPTYNFYAHTKNEENLNCNQDETLVEHTQSCILSFKRIIEEKGLEKVFSYFEKVFLRGFKEEELEVFRDMLLNTITFHDIGKINPLFQKDKMNNPQFANIKGILEFGSRHARISAIFYLEYFLPISKDFLKENRSKLRLLACVNAYVIAKHHTRLDQFEDFLKDILNADRYKHEWKVLAENYKEYLTKKATFLQEGYGKKIKRDKIGNFQRNEKDNMFLYAYTRLLHSLLIASDYYATTEYGDNYILETHGNIKHLSQLKKAYENSQVIKKIKECERKIKTHAYQENRGQGTDINVLRSELFLEVQNELKKHREQRVFYLEAPTGSGKSNIALNLSLKLLDNCSDLKKIWYIYPFNTLVEQNLKTLKQIFQNNSNILEQISVVNSITPMGNSADNITKDEEELELNDYVKILLDRQFFHYPVILSTHVTLFDILFGVEKSSDFGFYQLVGSVIVLDEIQSYRNEIWTEIITFLKEFAELLQIKIIIMSATLPDLDLLSERQVSAVKLIKDRERYFNHPLFKDRVELCYELLEKENILEELLTYIKKYLYQDKKVLVEFLSKCSAINFFKQIQKEEKINCKIRLMTGDDSSAERSKILKEIEGESESRGFLLIATQVIEAGVDLNGIDIGFKDISSIDSEEQFMGRINRSARKKGKVYFFNMDQATKIYGNDIRLNKKLTLMEEPMRQILVEKSFEEFYKKVFEEILQVNKSSDRSKSISEFYMNVVGKLGFEEVYKRMRLIKQDMKQTTVFLARELTIFPGEENEEILNGKEIWEEYECILEKNDSSYARKKVRLSIVKSKMSYFMYQIPINILSQYTKQIGEIYYIEDGEKYFKDGKLNVDMFLNFYEDFI